MAHDAVYKGLRMVQQTSGAKRLTRCDSRSILNITIIIIIIIVTITIIMIIITIILATTDNRHAAARCGSCSTSSSPIPRLLQ